MDYAMKVYTLHRHVLGFTNLLGLYDNDNVFMKAAKDAFKDLAIAELTRWKQKYGDS